MSVQRWYWRATGGMYALDPDEIPGRGFIGEADHARIVAEMEQAHAAALDDIGTRLSMKAEGDYFMGLRHGGEDAAAPRILTADNPEPSVGSVVLDAEGNVWHQKPKGCWYRAGRSGYVVWSAIMRYYGPVTLIHDGEATP